MPACGSESYPSGASYRSCSPPNSRSNSASPPPLTWPGGSRLSPIGTLKRSFSNLSNSSLHYGNNTSLFEQKRSTSATTLDSSCIHSPPPPSPPSGFSCLHHHYQTKERDHELRNDGTSRQQTNSAFTSIIYRKSRQDEVGGTSDGKSDREGNNARSIKNMFLPARLLAWYTSLVSSIVRKSYDTLSYVIWAPIFWISAWICVLWVLMQIPLNLIKCVIRCLYTPASKRACNKRCVLITGGSTLQALHLARNFYKAGTRVVVCEIEGLFGLARFSTACSRFYTVPRPGPGTAAEYVSALKKIVENEKAQYFIPVSCTSGAYYDALAKPHLEIMGCECFVPGAADITALEDPQQLLRRCVSLGLRTPVHFVLNSPDDLVRLYESGKFAGTERHVILAAGPAGMRERTKLLVPSSPPDETLLRNFRRKLDQYEISERRPWLVIREPIGPNHGYQLVTCTTVKDSRVVANVTCRLDESRGLVPEERTDVDQWLEIFFARSFATRINGHLSFKLAFSGNDGLGLVAIGCRVGVPLPYLCLTSVHSRLVWQPCRHFSRQHSANLLVNDRYKQTNVSSSNIKGLSARNRSVVAGATNVIDKRDVLFVYWDPLPYCAYYHLQLPFRRLAGVIREQPAQHKPPLAVVQ